MAPRERAKVSTPSKSQHNWRVECSPCPRFYGIPRRHVSIHCFVGKRFLSVGPRLPTGAKAVWPNQGALRDRSGEWWLLTRERLWRFPPIDLRQLAFARPSAVYDRSRGLVRDSVSALYEDRTVGDYCSNAAQETAAACCFCTASFCRFSSAAR